jgi:hypothetical protein
LVDIATTMGIAVVSVGSMSVPGIDIPRPAV